MKTWLTILALLVSFFLFGCDQDQKKDPTPIPPLTVKMESESSVSLAHNAMYQIVLAVSNTSSEDQKISIKYDTKVVSVAMDGAPITAEMPVHKTIKDKCSFMVTPVGSGVTNIEITVNDGGNREYKGTCEVTVWGNGPAPDPSTGLVKLVFTEIKPMCVTRRRVIKWEIQATEGTTDVTAKYTMSAKVVKGKGVFTIGEEVVWNDTIPNFTPVTREQIPYSYMGMYTPYAPGENIIEFTMVDHKGNKSVTHQTIQVDSTSFNPELVDVPTKLFVGQRMADLTFKIKPIKYVQVKYWLRMEGFTTPCAIVDGTRRLESTSQEKFPISVTNAREEGADDRSRADIMFGLAFTSGSDKEYKGRIIVGDDQGKEYSFDISINGQSPTISLTASQEEQSVYAYETARNYMYLSLDNYNPSYTPSEIYVTFTPVSGCEDMKLRNGSYDFMEWDTEMLYRLSLEDDHTKQSGMFYVVAGAAGEKEWDITVRDNFGGKTTYRQKMTIHDNPLSATTESLLSQKVTLGKGEFGVWKFKVSLLRDAGSKLAKYNVWATSDKKGAFYFIPGETVADGERIEITNTAPSLQYTPLEPGTHNVTFNASLPDGRVVTRYMTVETNYALPQGEIITGVPNVYEGEDFYLNTKLSQVGFGNGQFRYKVRFVQGAGELSYKGMKITPGMEYTAPAAVNGTVLFNLDYQSGGYIGPVQVEMEAIGGNNQSAKITSPAFTVLATTPSISVTAPDANIYTRSVDLTVDVSKYNYAGKKLKISYAVVRNAANQGSGSMDKENNLEFKNGKYIYKYTAASYGNTRVKFTVTDEFGRSSSTTVAFYINPLKLTTNLNSKADDIYEITLPIEISTERQFTMTVGEDGGYNGTFEFYWSGSVCDPDSYGEKKGEILVNGNLVNKLDSINLPAGTHTITIRNTSSRYAMWGTLYLNTSHSGAVKQVYIRI